MGHDIPLMSYGVLKYYKSRRDIIYDGRSVIIARPPHYFPRQLHAIRLLFRKALYMGYREIVIHNGTRLSFDELWRFKINNISPKLIYDICLGIIARPPHNLPRQLHAIRLLFLKALFMCYREVVINKRTRPSFDELLRFKIN